MKFPWVTDPKVFEQFESWTQYKVVKNNGTVAVVKNVENGEKWQLTEFDFIERDEDGMLEGFCTDEDLLEAGWELIS